MKTSVLWRRLRAVIRELLVECLNRLPAGAILTIRSRVILRCALDYPRSDIYLDVQSSDEYYLRLRSCYKEPETVEWIEKFVRENDVFYDIGANVGAYSLIASRFANGKATVYAFEP